MAIVHRFTNDGNWIRFTTRPGSPYEVERYFDSLVGQEKIRFEEVCKNLPDPRQCLWDMIEARHTAALMQYGQLFVPKTHVRPVPYFQKSWHCYENSFRHADANNLFYVEGMAVNPSGAAFHAWNTTDGTDVIDLTWPYQHVNRYFGAIFPVPFVKERIGNLGFLWRHHLPVP